MLRQSSQRLLQEMAKKSMSILNKKRNRSLMAILDEETVSAAWNSFGKILPSTS